MSCPAPRVLLSMSISPGGLPGLISGKQHIPLQTGTSITQSLNSVYSGKPGMLGVGAQTPVQGTIFTDTMSFLTNTKSSTPGDSLSSNNTSRIESEGSPLSQTVFVYQGFPGMLGQGQQTPLTNPATSGTHTDTSARTNQSSLSIKPVYKRYTQEC